MGGHQRPIFMSEAESRLNLIQRAMQRSALSPPKPPAAPRPELSAEAALVGGTTFAEENLRPENTLSEQINGTHSIPRVPAEPMQVLKGAEPVHFDHPQVSADRIITPDSTSSSTCAEFRSLKRKLIP